MALEREWMSFFSKFGGRTVDGAQRSPQNTGAGKDWALESSGNRGQLPFKIRDCLCALLSWLELGTGGRARLSSLALSFRWSASIPQKAVRAR